ncbi:hypothetical protein CTheo_2279 [Ceratobasidium theobromae]|uniref:RmlD-like substrate binding domain-containing protein n=1 Tax=Ceratobasidium theobromae TaxID=1582974 RepID=A0A5N5QRU9_9AGAM|nr:hypothetical protein CTheo_2279 [Ceratobasidium theobromae]
MELIRSTSDTRVESVPSELSRRNCGIIHSQHEGSCYRWGASGVLGRAVYKAFQAETGFKVKGIAHTRPSGEIEAVDLCDEGAATILIQSFKPDWVIHCAAERRPDVAAKDPQAARTLNAEVPRTLARLSASENQSFALVYISTDYVFDGTSAPYGVDAKPNPLNFYGETKLAGENAVLDNTYLEKPGQRVVLRVPVLYGPAPKNSDSAINVLVDIVNDQSGKKYTMDHYATRYPTNVVDIAEFLVRLTRLNKSLPPILHYSGTEPYTKYEVMDPLLRYYNVLISAVDLSCPGEDLKRVTRTHPARRGSSTSLSSGLEAKE